MATDLHPLRSDTAFDPGLASGDRLQLIRAAGPGARLEVPAGTWSLWLPLRHDLHMESACSRWRLPRRHLLITRDAMQGHAEGPGTWLVLAGPQNAWNTVMRTIPSPPPGWLPMQAPCERKVLRAFVRLARLLRDDREPDACEAATLALCTMLMEQQCALQPLTNRCNGRTPQRRYLTLQRLLRVHHLIEHDSDNHFSLARLARVASYSPWHLIRMYRDAFGETPSEHAARLRLARAWSMVRESEMPVCEITERLGFESQSAFCRAFKSAYGLTTTQARRLPATALRQISPRPTHARPRTQHAPPLPSARHR
ncbi:AraC family transcriptional regulator [Lysobacter sp. Root494]|uniref:helix-turn-helix transcriptional regulator n=1 Tax=Lysobacter sp. Root494 TaxID=1736549 RepID=UPI000A5C8FFB|nr:AraC family transcriptional regulator [Lysobacter sp. Root494]